MEQLSSLKNLEKIAKEFRSEDDNGSGTWQVGFFVASCSLSFSSVLYMFRTKFYLQNKYANMYLFCGVLIVTL